MFDRHLSESQLSMLCCDNHKFEKRQSSTCLVQGPNNHHLPPPTGPLGPYSPPPTTGSLGPDKPPPHATQAY